MNSLEHMSIIVDRELRRKGTPAIHTGFTNGNRCYYMMTEDEGTFVLKWSKQMYRMVNFLREFKGKGAGMTINRDFVEELHSSDQKTRNDTTLLFSTLETDTSVYGLTLKEFRIKSAEHEQPANGEWVYAIPVKLLDKFC